MIRRHLMDCNERVLCGADTMSVILSGDWVDVGALPYDYPKPPPRRICRECARIRKWRRKNESTRLAN